MVRLYEKFFRKCVRHNHKQDLSNSRHPVQSNCLTITSSLLTSSITRRMEASATSAISKWTSDFSRMLSYSAGDRTGKPGPPFLTLHWNSWPATLYFSASSKGTEHVKDLCPSDPSKTPHPSISFISKLHTNSSLKAWSTHSVWYIVCAYSQVKLMQPYSTHMAQPRSSNVMSKCQKFSVLNRPRCYVLRIQALRAMQQLVQSRKFTHILNSYMTVH